MGIISVDIGGRLLEREGVILDEAGHERMDGDVVEFARAGAAATGEYHCSSCGYGITVRDRLPQCPMCAGSTWEPVEWAFPRRRYQA